jgi:hypothetical protein
MPRSILGLALASILLSASGCATLAPPIESGVGVSWGSARGPEWRVRLGVSPTQVVSDAHELPVDVAVGAELALASDDDAAWLLYTSATGTAWRLEGNGAPRLRLGGELLFDIETLTFGGGLIARLDSAGFVDIEEITYDLNRENNVALAWGELSIGLQGGLYYDPRTGFGARLDVPVRLPAAFGGVGLAYIPDRM